MADEIKHDAERWGSRYTHESDPREVTRLADVVMSRTDHQHKPIPRAAAEVADILAKRPPDEWFMFVKGDCPKKLGLSDLWCPPNLPPQYVIEMARGDQQAPVVDWQRIDEKSGWAQFDVDPELLGSKGAIACLCEAWAAAATEADLNEGVASHLAILRTDAQCLFGFDDAAAVHQLRPVKPAVPEALVTEPPAAAELDGASLLRRQDELKAAKHKSPTQQLVVETGLSERAIQRSIKQHRSKPGLLPSLESAWCGSSKVHRSK